MKTETAHEFTERIWGRKLSKKEVELLLWHCTAFPCVDVERLELQLSRVRTNSKGDVELAAKQADKIMDKAMKSPLK